MRLRMSLLVAAVVAGSVISIGHFGAADAEAGCPRGCMIAAATTYLDALVSHDPPGVSLTAGAIRTENGIATGNNADEIRASLANDPRFQVIIGLRDIRWIVEDDQAVAFYLIDTGLVPGVPAQSSTVHVSERFTITDGLISQIEAVFCFAGGSVPEGSRNPSIAPEAASLCSRSGSVGA